MSELSKALNLNSKTTLSELKAIRKLLEKKSAGKSDTVLKDLTKQLKALERIIGKLPAASNPGIMKKINSLEDRMSRLSLYVPYAG